MLKKLNKIDSKVVSENKYWQYLLDKYSLPDDSIGEYHYIRTQGSTMIIPVLEPNLLVMTRQYRYLNQKESIEFPGGGILSGSTPTENAMNELVEETGYLAEKIHKIGQFNPMNGVTNEICYVYVAENLRFDKPRPEITEEFEIIKITKLEIIGKIHKGEIWDGMTLASWAIFANAHGKF